MPSTLPVFYDCEASGLDGFPIEIGWAFTEPKTGVIMSEGHLIRPPASWLAEGRWDPDAEALHGVSLVQLHAEGRPVWEVARHMNQALDGRELFSDSPLDQVWLRRIFDEAGLDPDFIVRKMDAEALIMTLATNRGLDADVYAKVKVTAARLAPRRHRAEADARHLAVIWKTVMTTTQ